MADWRKIKLRFISSESGVKLADLAREFDVPESTIRYKAREGRWKEQRDRYHRKLDSRVLNVLQNEQVDKLKKYGTICDRAIEAFGRQLDGKIEVECPKCGETFMVSFPKAKVKASDISSLMKIRVAILDRLESITDTQKKTVKLPSNIKDLDADHIQAAIEDAGYEVIDGDEDD